MPGPLTPTQIKFYSELLAPFPEAELSKKQRFTFIDARALANRLDQVCTPAGWKVEYVDVPDGKRCRVSILVPGPTVEEWRCPDEDAGWFWVSKEDGAGHEGMTDADNDEKSGYTNSFRRTCQCAWGMARYLYPVGKLNAYHDHLQALEHPKVKSPIARPPDRDEAVEIDPRQFDPPKAGDTLWSWLLGLTKVYQTNVSQFARTEATRRGFRGGPKDWTQPQVDELFGPVVQYCKSLPTYAGQFDKVSPGKSTTAVLGTNIADLRRTIKDKLTAHYKETTGNEPTIVELKAAFQNLAANSKNADGADGEVPEALNRITDEVWLRNMISTLDSMVGYKQEEVPAF